MKKITALFILVCLTALLVGCNNNKNIQILTTTKPLYHFTNALCEETPLEVDLLVSENVSCLHDYTLQVSQMRMLESAEVIIVNGAGFEDFLTDALPNNKSTIDCSLGINLHCGEKHYHSDHTHEQDPHIWLSINNAKIMTENIYNRLCDAYPQYERIFSDNLSILYRKFADLESKAHCLKNLTCRELITFHNGFTYMAESFDLHIVKAIEEESGSEASANELIEIIEDIRDYNLPAIFTEASSGSTAATIIAAETGVNVYELDMALSNRDYFEAMKYNIETLKEALE